MPNIEVPRKEWFMMFNYYEGTPVLGRGGIHFRTNNKINGNFYFIDSSMSKGKLGFNGFELRNQISYS